MVGYSPGLALNRSSAILADSVISVHPLGDFGGCCGGSLLHYARLRARSEPENTDISSANVILLSASIFFFFMT